MRILWFFIWSNLVISGKVEFVVHIDLTHKCIAVPVQGHEYVCAKADYSEIYLKGSSSQNQKYM